MSSPRPSRSRFPFRRDAPSAPETIAPRGMWLFAFYVALYASFIGVSIADPEGMNRSVGPANLAVVFGFTLIVVAIVLAVLHVRRQARADDEPRGGA